MPTMQNDLAEIRGGISQRKVAMFLGLSNTTIAKWEKAPTTDQRRRMLYQRAIAFLSTGAAA